MNKIKCFLIVEEGELVREERNDGIVSFSHKYRNQDTGELLFLHEHGVGAIWDATWYHDVKWLCGIDGHSYCVKTPGGDWTIDGRASNCGLPNDNEHKCWVRHGDAPNFTVDKNGKTCNAGAGSIQCGSYHGFLTDGYLVEC